MASFKIDENLPIEFAAMLSARGHDALTVNDQKCGGSPDPNLAKICQRENRALVTLDLDFADIRAYPPTEYPGILVLRPYEQSKSHLIALFTSVLPILEHEPLAGWLWVVDETGIRFRGADHSP